MRQPESPGPGAAGQPSEEEMRAQLEAELRRLRVEDVVAQAAVSVLNLGARRAGLAGGQGDEVDPAQVETAIEAVGALLPVLERRGAGEEVRPLRDALAQLQLAYARARGPAGPGEPAGAAPSARPGEAEPPPSQAGGSESPGAEGPGPAQSSGRLWIPGQ